MLLTGVHSRVLCLELRPPEKGVCIDVRTAPHRPFHAEGRGIGSRREQLPDHERGSIISDASSMNPGDQIVYPRDDPAEDVVFCILSIQGRFVDLGVPEEWSE